MQKPNLTGTFGIEWCISDWLVTAVLTSNQIENTKNMLKRFQIKSTLPDNRSTVHKTTEQTLINSFLRASN